MEEKDRIIEQAKEKIKEVAPDVVVMGPGEPTSMAYLAGPEPNDVLIIDEKTANGNPFTKEQAKEFAKKLKQYYELQRYAYKPGERRKPQKLSKEVIHKKLKAKKAARRQSNKSRKINQKWNKK